MNEKPWTLEEAQTYWMLTFPTLYNSHNAVLHGKKSRQLANPRTSVTTPDIVMMVTSLLAEIHDKIVSTDKSEKTMTTSIDFFSWIIRAEKLTTYDFAITVEQDTSNAAYNESCLYAMLCASCTPQVLETNVRGYIETQKLLANTLKHKNCSETIMLTILQACQHFSDHDSWLYYRHGASLILPELVTSNMFNDPNITEQSIVLCQKTADQIFVTLKSMLKRPVDTATFNLYQNLNSVYLLIAQNSTANGTVVAEKLLSPNIANVELSTAIIQRTDITPEFLENMLNNGSYPSQIVNAVKNKMLVQQSLDYRGKLS